MATLTGVCQEEEEDKFLIRALSPLLNGTLHQWYIVTALKIIM